MYQLYLISSGVTTNETYKWEDLKYAIHNKSISKMPNLIYQYNQQYSELLCASGGIEELKRRRKDIENLYKRKQTDEKQHRQQNVVEYIDLASIGNPQVCVKQLVNIYNKGAWNNLMDVLFPVSFETEKKHE